MKFKRVSIVFLFLSGIVFTFLLCAVFIIILAIISIKKIDKVLWANISESLYERKADTLLELNKRKATNYDRLFREAMVFAEMLSVEVRIVREFIPYYHNYNMSTLVVSSLSYDPERKIYFNNPIENPRIFYWGDSELNRDLFYRIRAMLSLEVLMKALMKGISEQGKCPYFAAFIANSNEHFLLDYFYDPKIGANLIPPDQERFNKYYSTHTIKDDGWTEVYKDITGYFLVTTYRKIIDKEGNVLGRAGVDFSIDYIIQDLKNFHYEVFHSKESIDNSIGLLQESLNDKSFSFILNMDDGEFIACQKSRLNEMGITPKNIDTMDYQALLNLKITDSKLEQLKQLFRSFQKVDDKYATLDIDNRRYIIVYSKIHVNNWGLFSFVPMEELMGSVLSAKEYLVQSFFVLSINLIIMGLIYVTICIAALAFFFRKILILPIYDLEIGVKKLMKGELGIKVKQAGAREVYEMISSFNFLSEKLSKYSSEVKERITNRLYIEHEVDIARHIQSAVLPQPNLAGIGDFEIDISGKVISRDLISSVFYDYFLLSKDKLAFLIGEVSGKSIPAAFYMMLTKTLIKDACMKYPNSPADVLGEVNHHLCRKNVDMFISLGLVFYDKKQSKLFYSFAGFASMFRMAPSGFAEELTGQKSPVLGLINDAFYQYEEKLIIPRTKLILFTRGVMDSMNSRGHSYSFDAVVRQLKICMGIPAGKACSIIADDIVKFGDIRNEDKAILIFQGRDLFN
ncbi:MAG: hypothetical protein A2X47_04925 [Lentisphaerae bacterium GWF2_38_69]|nr:MAG: hypothetical protein A2X47_04925 [Lentisphaerae bacterium GWF2_38_69]